MAGEPNGGQLNHVRLKAGQREQAARSMRMEAGMGRLRENLESIQERNARADIRLGVLETKVAMIQRMMWLLLGSSATLTVAVLIKLIFP